MTVCHECVHWQPPKQQAWGDETHGVCIRVTHEDTASPAYTMDWEGMNSELRTRFDFGCILFLQRPLPERSSTS